MKDKFMKEKRFYKYTTGILLVLVILMTGVISIGWYTGSTDYYAKYRIFQQIFLRILENYVEEVKPEEMLDKAIDGMITELDPHTQYMRSKANEDFEDRLLGYEGIGISFAIINKKITVMSIIENGPSYRAGLQLGDRIVEIEGESAIGMENNDVPLKLKGPPNTAVKIGVEREGTEELQHFTIVRQKVNLESIDSAFMLDNEVAYIRLDRFSSTTGIELKKAMSDLTILGMKKLVLDLRWNGGGLLHEACEVADCFLPKDRLIVYTKGRTGYSNKEYKTKETSPWEKLPLIILINEISASASEIVSGAIQDWDRGLIVGKTSFGKGLAQTPFPMADGSALLLTTSRYFTPSGRLIQRDFGNKSRENYYLEAIVDSLKETIKQNPNRPEFSTMHGRQVFGAGGINPDIELDYSNPDSILNDMKLALNLFRQGYIFEFSIKYGIKNKLKNIGLNKFIDTFSLTEKVMNDFMEYLNSISYEYEKNILTENRKGLEILIKRDISFQLWGANGLRKFLIANDKQFNNSLSFFPKAKEMLDKFVGS